MQVLMVSILLGNPYLKMKQIWYMSQFFSTVFPPSCNANWRYLMIASNVKKEVATQLSEMQSSILSESMSTSSLGAKTCSLLVLLVGSVLRLSCRCCAVTHMNSLMHLGLYTI